MLHHPPSKKQEQRFANFKHKKNNNVNNTNESHNNCNFHYVKGNQESWNMDIFGTNFSSCNDQGKNNNTYNQSPHKSKRVN
jgi:hypothetical protein